LIQQLVAQFPSHFPHKNVEHVNDPPAVTGLSSLQKLVVHILHQDSRVCNSEHNNYSFCDFVQLCVLELFIATDRSECKVLVKSVHVI
jgi:hypothetical protein